MGEKTAGSASNRSQWKIWCGHRKSINRLAKEERTGARWCSREKYVSRTGLDCLIPAGWIIANYQQISLLIGSLQQFQRIDIQYTKIMCDGGMGKLAFKDIKPVPQMWIVEKRFFRAFSSYCQNKWQCDVI